MESEGIPIHHGQIMDEAYIAFKSMHGGWWIRPR
jgi:hypothetical protein